MRRLSMGGRLNQKRVIFTAIVTVVVLAIVIVWLSKHHKNNTSISTGNKAPSNAVIAEADTKNAEKALDSSNYQKAINYYIEAVNSAEAEGKFDQAESLLKDAINKIPDNQVPWIIYDDMVGLAKAKKDTKLEISSLKKAIIKAQQPNSGAPQGIVDVYNKMLKQLGAA